MPKWLNAIGSGLQTFGGMASGTGSGRSSKSTSDKVAEGAEEAGGKKAIDLDEALRQVKKAEQRDVAPSTSNAASLVRKGGRIRKTGVYVLHKGEVVVPANTAKRIGKRKTSRKPGRR